MARTDLHSVLVIAPNWLGDAVMSLPLLGLLAAVPSVRLRVLAPEYTSRVFWGIEGVDDMIVHARSAPSRHVMRRSRIVRRLGVDGSIVLPPSFSSALTAWLARVPVRVGYAGDARRYLLTEAPSAGGLRDEHLSENYLRLGRVLLDRLGVEAAPSRMPRLEVYDNERDAVSRVLDSVKAPSSGYAVVVPGAVYGSTKTWPREKFRELVAKLSRRVPVVVSGGPGERELCTGVAKGLPDVYNVAGRTSLGEFFALLDRATVVVANDSGAPHAAAALGVPVVVIFGSTSPRWTAPLGSSVHIVHAPVHCSPCFLEECPTQLECYAGISAGDVLDATSNVIGKGARRLGSG